MENISIQDFMHNLIIKTKVQFKYILAVTAIISMIQASCHKKDENLPGKPAPVEKPKPIIKNFSPDHSFYGDTIIIEDSHFKDNDDVCFYGILATTILGCDSIHFKLLIPEEAFSSSIQILQGMDTAGSASAFNVDHHIYISGY